MDGYGAASYGDGMADVYDVWYRDLGDVEGAVATLADLAGAGPVLELGVGSGRLALPLAATGLEVHGVDASEAMVDLLRAKPGGDRIPVTLGDMADVPTGTTRFSLAFVAYNTFFNLTSEDAQRRCLRGVRASLRPGGRFVLEAFVPAPDAPTSSVGVRTVALDHVVLEVTRHDRAAQAVVGQHVELREEGTRLRPWMIRYATPAQLDAMAADAGLVLDARWSDWRRTPFTDDSSTHVSVYATAP